MEEKPMISYQPFLIEDVIEVIVDLCRYIKKKIRP